MRVLRYSIADGDDTDIAGAIAIDNEREGAVIVHGDTLFLSKETGGVYVMNPDLDTYIDSGTKSFATCRETGALINGGESYSVVTMVDSINTGVAMLIAQGGVIGARMIRPFTPSVVARRSRMSGEWAYTVMDGVLRAQGVSFGEIGFPIEGKAIGHLLEKTHLRAIVLRPTRINDAVIDIITNAWHRMFDNEDYRVSIIKETQLQLMEVSNVQTE